MQGKSHIICKQRSLYTSFTQIQVSQVSAAKGHPSVICKVTNHLPNRVHIPDPSLREIVVKPSVSCKLGLFLSGSLVI